MRHQRSVATGFEGSRAQRSNSSRRPVICEEQTRGAGMTPRSRPFLRWAEQERQSIEKGLAFKGGNL